MIRRKGSFKGTFYQRLKHILNVSGLIRLHTFQLVTELSFRSPTCTQLILAGSKPGMHGAACRATEGPVMLPEPPAGDRSPLKFLQLPNNGC